MKYVKTFAAFINEGTVNESKQITVITYRGKFTTYKDKDIKKMIDHFSSAISSDDLPKWIYTTGMEGNPDFPKKPEKVKDLLKKILDYDDDVVIDIDSSKPLYKRNIKFIGESITEASHVAPESEEPVKDEVEEAKEEVGSNIWAIYFKYDNNHRAELPAAIVWAESSKAANVFSSTGPVQPLVGIANPTGSVVNAMLMQIKIVWASGTAAASGAVLAGLAVSGVTGAGGNAAINTGSLSAGGSAVSTFVAAAMTGQTVAHQLLDFIGGPSTGALAANSYPYTVIDYKGLFSCPPGGSLILAAAAAGTSPIVACSMQWAELPV